MELMSCSIRGCNQGAAWTLTGHGASVVSGLAHLCQDHFLEVCMTHPRSAAQYVEVAVSVSEQRKAA